jgi:hypothetical protein
MGSRFCSHALAKLDRRPWGIGGGTVDRRIWRPGANAHCNIELSVRVKPFLIT